MAKININGEWFDYDFDRKPMSEALALENATGMRYADWESELAAGSMKAMCGLVWLVWRRAGRDTPLADILSGEAEVDLMPLLDSLQALAAEEQEPAPDPTSRARSRRARTPTTSTSTSPSSPESST
jgi:hypothetical protein